MKANAMISALLLLVGVIIVLMFFMLPEYMTSTEKMFVVVIGVIFILGSVGEMFRDG
jgi:membrane protein YdbS with pleckstrin-like domain